MAKKLGFGTDGVRGRAYSELTLQLATKIGWACSRSFNIETVVIGGDTRESTPDLVSALAAGVVQGATEPVTIVNLETIPTPAVAVVSAELDTVGFMVSASHNPWHDNGIKVFGPGGTKLTTTQQNEIETLIGEAPELQTSLETVEPNYRSASIDDIEALSAQWVNTPQKALKDIADTADADIADTEEVTNGRNLSDMKVVVDCANGAASAWANKVFSQIGVQTEIIAATPDGRNINQDCGSTSLNLLSERVVTSGADLGLALDGDADRLLAVDNHGQTVDGDKLLALFALDLKHRGQLANNTLVVTVMSNLGLHQSMATSGIDVHITAVGDRSVAAGMETTGAVIGGEQSGHIIFSRYSSTGDGVFSAARLIDLVARKGRPLSELAAEVMQTFPQVLKNVEVHGDRTAIMAALAPAIASAEEQLGTNGRVLVRPSGTEPLVRVMVEASTEKQAQEVSTSLVEAINSLK